MNKWRKHVTQVYKKMKKQNKNVLLKDALKEASASWDKVKKGGNCGGLTDKTETTEEIEKEKIPETNALENFSEGGRKTKKNKSKSKRGGKSKKNKTNKRGNDFTVGEDGNKLPMYM